MAKLFMDMTENEVTVNSKVGATYASIVNKLLQACLLAVKLIQV